MKAFCNCPLNPVFQGPIVLVALLLQMINMAEARMTENNPTDNPTIRFRGFPDFPAAGLVVSVALCSWLGVGVGIGAGDSFFLFGFAGNEPLLLLGRVSVGPGWVGATILGGMAARLLDCSTSTRRTFFSWLSTFQMTPDSGKSGKCHKSTTMYMFLRCQLSILNSRKGQKSRGLPVRLLRLSSSWLCGDSLSKLNLERKGDMTLNKTLLRNRRN